MVAATLVLTACNVGGGDGEGHESGPEAPVTGSDGGEPAAGGPTPDLPVPEGVVLADPGSEHGLGETATIAWKIKGGDVGVLAVKVRKLVKAHISDLKDWQLDRAGRRASLYYVTMTVANAGETDLSGLRVPLYVRERGGALVESSEFKTDFDPCPSPDLPKGFEPAEKVTFCQAYLVPRHGKLEAVAFAPTPRFNPVTWVGKVTQPKRPKKKPSAG